METSSPVRNSNLQNFIKESSKPKQVFRIQPDKETFLKSNLLVSNILNKNISNEIEKQKQSEILHEAEKSCKKPTHIKSKSEEEALESDAYVNCEVEMKKLENERQSKKQRIQNVRNLAKCRSQKTFDEFVHEEKKISDKIHNVYLMRRELCEKAGEIMGKHEDTSYMGRHLFQQKENMNKIKQTNPSQKVHKSEMTRLMMKQSAKKCNRNQYKQQLEDSIVHQNQSMRDLSSNSILNSSLNLSTDTIQGKALEQKFHQDQVLRRLIKSKSAQKFEQEQRRKAAWDGFAVHWKKGTLKGESKAQQLKKKSMKSKKPMRSRFESANDNHDILNYSDQFSRHEALQKFSNAFRETAASHQIRMAD